MIGAYRSCSPCPRRWATATRWGCATSSPRAGRSSRTWPATRWRTSTAADGGEPHRGLAPGLPERGGGRAGELTVTFNEPLDASSVAGGERLHGDRRRRPRARRAASPGRARRASGRGGDGDARRAGARRRHGHGGLRAARRQPGPRPCGQAGGNVLGQGGGERDGGHGRAGARERVGRRDGADGRDLRRGAGRGLGARGERLHGDGVAGRGRGRAASPARAPRASRARRWR